MDDVNDCVIVGAGPGGLAASAALTELGVDHLVLERGQVGETWRRQRWDSFRLNTPGWMNAVLGEQPRDAYLTAPETVARLERLAAKAPLRERTAVVGLRQSGEGFTLDTGDGEAGFFEQRPADLPDPSLIHQRQPIVAPGGRGLGLPQLARSGVTLVGRLVEVSGEQARFDGSAAANVATGEAFATRVRGLVDDIITRRGVIVPPAGPEDVGAQVDLRPPPDQPALVDLRAHDVSAVVWCTGFRGDFSWLPRELRGPDGDPRRVEAAAPVPGLLYLGLRWLIRRASSILYGLPGDAATVAHAVKAQLSARSSG